MSSNTRAPSTIVTIALTGQTEFNIPFEYLARKYVEVTLLGIDRLPLVLNTDFRFVTKTLISLTRPYTSEYTQIELRRVTSATERLVDFHDGSILRAYDLNLSQIQTLHVAEEARDLTADTIGVNDEGHLDARNRKIVNLAYAENGSDAIPLGQVIQWNDSAYNSMVRAEAARDTAEASRDAAHLSETSAAADAVATAADRVVTQADASITSVNVTITQEDVVKCETAAARAEAAAAPAIEVFERLAVVEGKAASAESTVVGMESRVTDLEHYPKVIKLSDIFEGTSVWGFSDSEFNVIEHKDYYHIQGIFRTISGGGAGGTLGTFKHDVGFSFAPCGVSENPSSATTYAYISRGWTGADYGRSIELLTSLQNSSWVMSSFVVIKGP